MPQDQSERAFRRGVAHGAAWLRETASNMAKAGTTGEEIADRLENLCEVLEDWREDRIETPEGNPWDWDSEELDTYIEAHHNEW